MSGFSIELATLRSLRATIGAALIQVDSRIQALTGTAPDAAASCPRCSGTELQTAGDVEVCADCGANVKDGAVVAG